MIVIPDLFGSYQKGRDAAIEANWKDLRNYEDVESARHQNDAAALTNLATMADFGVRRRMVQNEGTNSDLTTELNQVSQIGKLANAYANNTLGLVNNDIIQSNIPYLRTIGSTALQTYGNNIETSNNNSVTNLYNSDILRYVTEATYPKTRQAAYETQEAKNITAMLTALYGPKTTELVLKAGLVNAGTSVVQAGNNSVVARTNAKHIAEQAELQNRVATQTLQNAIKQGKLDGRTIDNALVGLNPNTKIATLTSMLATATAANDQNAVAAINAALFKEQGSLLKSYGYTGTIPVLNASGQQIGTATTNADGTTSITSGTGRTAQIPTTNLMGYTPPSLSDIATRMGSNTGNVMGVQNIGGVPNIPTAQRTSTAVHFLPNGRRVVTTAPVSSPTQSPSQSQLIKNLSNRRGGFL